LQRNAIHAGTKPQGYCVSTQQEKLVLDRSDWKLLVIIYDGHAEMLDKEEQYPLDAVVHAELIRRMRGLGQGQKWIIP
jgi:hypothetical protein